MSKWDDIVEVYMKDCKHARMRLMPKLNDVCVIPEKIKKMKVTNCARVFRKTVAAALYYTTKFAQHADGSEVRATLKNTAEMVCFFYNLFDSVNGSAIINKKSRGKPLRTAITATNKRINK